MKYSSGLGITYGTHQTILRLIPKNSSILDIGCAQGYLEKTLSEDKKCQIYGIELEEAAARIAEKYCQKMLIGDVEVLFASKTPPYQDQKFDIILLADILEHLQDPHALLKKLPPLLNHGGKIIISMPNIAHWGVRLRLLFGKFDYTKTGIMDDTHTKFFTRKTAVEMIIASGLKPVSIIGIGDFNYLFSKIGLGSLGSAITNLISRLLAIQFIYVAQKDEIKS